MDFANRNQHRPAAPAPQAARPAATVSGASEGKTRKRFGLGGGGNKLLTFGALVILIGGTLLLVASILSLNFGADESKLVNKNDMQAVFVNVNGTTGGQVYFGKIKSLNKDYINLTDVFYIQNQAANGSNQSYNLVKLGCELHGPEDQMVINRGQVFFWENLKNNGQVATKAAEFKKQNPNGQNCNQSQQQGSTQQSTGGTGTTTTNGAATQAPAASNNTTTSPKQ